MGTPRYAGSTAPIQKNFKIKYDPTSGGELSADYHGLDFNQMLNLADINAKNGIICDLAFANSVATLTLTTTDPAAQGYANFNSIVDKWEVVVDTEQPTLFENPNFLSIFAPMDAAYYSAYGIYVSQQFFQVIKQIAETASAENQTGWGSLIEAINNTNLTDANGKEILPSDDIVIDGVDSDASMGAVYDNLASPNWSNLTGQGALKFFAEEYFRGRTNFQHDKYKLRHTTIAPATYGANVADFNVEKIYSISQLLSEVQNNNLWILPLPGYLAYKILAYPVPVNMPPNYTWGALKSRSNAASAARGRIEITQEYLIDAISVPTYGLKN
jgi:hypothetical protein